MILPDKPMKISAIKVFPLRIPLTVPIIMAGRSFVAAETVIFRVEADNGLYGYGEAVRRA